MKLLFLLALCGIPCAAQQRSLEFLNHNRPIVDAHNCYPLEGQFGNRIERALQLGYPIGIEQDLAWFVDPATGQGRVVVSHTPKTTGQEPTLQSYFFERVRPQIEKALRENQQSQWPLIVVHFDFKDNQPALLHAVWDLLGKYEDWITTAKKGTDPNQLAPLEAKPLLVMTEDSDAQEAVFFSPLTEGSKLRLFGSAHTTFPSAKTEQERVHIAATAAPEVLLREKPTNYRRWWNNSWYEVEEGGQPKAGEWLPKEAARLKALVNFAHQQGFWIRFYTLDGFLPNEDQGWGQGYNFGSHPAVEVRWKASLEAGVNLIASDQYEELATWVHGGKQ